MSNCFSSYPASNSSFFLSPNHMARNSVPNMNNPTMSSSMPTMSTHSLNEDAIHFVPPNGYHPHVHPHPAGYFVNGPNMSFVEEATAAAAAAAAATAAQPQILIHPNIAQYLHFQRMQHLNRAQYIHNQNINNLIANLYAYKRSQANSFAKNKEESDKNNQVIITEVSTDDEDDEYEIAGKKCIDKKDYIDAISIDDNEDINNNETLV